jgi:hypothetical protein
VLRITPCEAATVLRRHPRLAIQLSVLGLLAVVVPVLVVTDTDISEFGRGGRYAWTVIPVAAALMPIIIWVSRSRQRARARSIVADGWAWAQPFSIWGADAVRWGLGAASGWLDGGLWFGYLALDADRLAFVSNSPLCEGTVIARSEIARLRWEQGSAGIRTVDVLVLTTTDGRELRLKSGQLPGALRKALRGGAPDWLVAPR